MYISMFSDPLHKSCQPCPWGQNLSTPWVSLSSIDYKPSKSMRLTSNILCIYQCLVIPCINLASHAPEVQIGHVLGVICSHRLIFKKKMEKFSETMRQTAQVSSIPHIQIILCNKNVCNNLFLHACCLLFVFSFI